VNNSELKKKIITGKLLKIETSKLIVVLSDEKMKMSVKQCPEAVFLVICNPSMNEL
jgi:hypothetical protein